MTRKDYVLIANCLKIAMEQTSQPTGVAVASMHLAWALEKDNPRFNKEQFLSAIGIKA